MSDRRLSPDVWRVYSNPLTGDRLFADSRSGELRITREDLSAPWVRIPPCRDVDYKQFAERWIQEVPDAEKQKVLTISLQDPAGTSPKSPFVAATKLAGLESSWKHFRVASVLQLFDKTLEARQIPRAVDLAPAAAIPHIHVDAKRLLIDLIQDMSEAEIRAMLIPMGTVLDHLRKRGG